jgi:putative serine protease PepD
VALTQLDNHSSATTTASTPSATVRPASNPDPARTVYNSTKNSVVFVSADTDQGTATGSGFVVSSDGEIVTNEHVVDGAQQVTVMLGTSDQQLPATIVAADASKDLALLKVDTGGKTLHPLTFGDSSNVQVGDTTYAIGNPLGLDHTFTGGIVSALGRQIQAPDGTPIDNAIQTDAAINPGNSGGALLNSSGQVIGVNSQIASTDTSGGQAGNVGIGFAIPSNTVRDFIAHPTSTQSTQPEQQTQVVPAPDDGMGLALP